MSCRAFLLLTGVVALPLGGCVAPAEGPGYQSGGSILNPGGGDVLHGPLPLAGTLLSGTAPAGRAVALLAPVTGANAERGDALVKAAQLALLQPGAPPLDVRDTASTPEGAAAAAQAAIAAGDGIILGPLSAAETAAVAGPASAAGVPVLAFTNDPSQARSGVWTLGITSMQQVRRMVAAAASQGKTRYAALLPQGDFGRAMGDALTQAAAAAGGSADIHFHDDGNAAIAQSVREVSDYASRRGPIDARIKAARERHDAEGRQEAADLSRQSPPPPPFDALLLADTGGRLAWLSTFLPYYDIDSPSVRLMGPSLWALPAARAGAAISGAWYAAPDPAARAAFDQAYSAKYGTPAPGLADLAYDAASIARALGGAGGYTAGALCRPDGFVGADGVLALQSDGTVRRGLALFEVHGAGPTMVESAPDTLAAPGI